MLISENGSWQNNNLDGHGYDETLSNSIVKLCLKNNFTSLYDFGCGHGLYTKNLINNQINCDGYDGNKNTTTLTNGLCKVLDLSAPFKMAKKDIVLSLEVGEHIPKKFEFNFINNLDSHNEKGIILSWAVVGQGGDGHINCQNNDYIKNIFINLGYKNNLEDENYLRNNSKFSWFKNTIMVFYRG